MGRMRFRACLALVSLLSLPSFVGQVCAQAEPAQPLTSEPAQPVATDPVQSAAPAQPVATDPVQSAAPALAPEPAPAVVSAPPPSYALPPPTYEALEAQKPSSRDLVFAY